MDDGIAWLKVTPRDLTQMLTKTEPSATTEIIHFEISTVKYLK